MIDNDNKFSLFLVWMRNCLGLTGWEMSAALRCHRYHLARYEAGKKPGKEFYARLLKFIDNQQGVLKSEIKKRLDKVGPVETSTGVIELSKYRVGWKEYA